MRLRADRRSERQQEAIERNALWSKLSTAEKLLSLAKRRGCSKRQASKLIKESAK